MWPGGQAQEPQPPGAREWGHWQGFYPAHLGPQAGAREPVLPAGLGKSSAGVPCPAWNCLCLGGVLCPDWLATPQARPSSLEEAKARTWVLGLFPVLWAPPGRSLGPHAPWRARGLVQEAHVLSPALAPALIPGHPPQTLLPGSGAERTWFQGSP